MTDTPDPIRPPPRYLGPDDRRWFTPRILNVGLVVLAVAVLTLAVAAIRHGDSPAPAAALRFPPSTSTTERARPTATASPTPAATERALASVKSVLATKSPVRINVLGDSTGNSSGEWVDLWAKELGRSRQVTVHRWDSSTHDWFADSVTYGSDGPSVSIWNGSQSGAKAREPMTELDTIVPSSPDAVIYSFGHNDDASTVGSGLAATAAAIDKRWGSVPNVVILQNPVADQHRAAQESTRAAVSRWAVSAGVPTINVAKAFFDSADDVASMTEDNGQPNAAGSQLWADVVAAALG